MKDSTKHATLAKAERFLEQLDSFTESIEGSLDKARDDAREEIDQRRHELKKAKLVMQEDLKKLKADTQDNWEELYGKLNDSARRAREALNGLKDHAAPSGRESDSDGQRRTGTRNS